MVRVGLGALGVVTDLTLQCVPAHRLVEQTYVTTAQVSIACMGQARPCICYKLFPSPAPAPGDALCSRTGQAASPSMLLGCS